MNKDLKLLLKVSGIKDTPKNRDKLLDMCVKSVLMASLRDAFESGCITNAVNSKNYTIDQLSNNMGADELLDGTKWKDPYFKLKADEEWVPTLADFKKYEISLEPG